MVYWSKPARDAMFRQEAAEPVSESVVSVAVETAVDLAKLKSHLNIFDESEDTYLQDLILTAQEYVANFLGEYVSDTTIDVRYTQFRDHLELGHRYIKSVSYVQYLKDGQDTPVTVDTSKYVFDNTVRPARVVLRSSQDSFLTTGDQLHKDYNAPITVRYVAGIPDDSAIHAPKLIALSMLAATFYKLGIQNKNDRVGEAMEATVNIFGRFRRIEV